MTFAVWILVKATATLALALAVTRLARRTRAAARHVLLAAAFAILLVLPIASMLAPRLRITLPIPLQGGANAAIADSVFTMIVESAVSPTPSPPPAVSRTHHRSFSPTALALWTAGALLFLGRFLLGLRQARTLRADAQPLHRAQSMADAEVANVGMRRLEVLRHESVTGPMTCGVLRPVVFLPTDACSWSDDDLHRAIVHELAHVRRCDWLTQSIARATAACYWFHPLVWLAWRRFALEAERACDDAVLERAEAAAYADQLVVLAQRILDRPSGSVLAMASRSELPSRVRALLDGGQRRGPAGAAWIATVGFVSTMLVASMAALQIVAAQRADDEPSQMFDVATVKPCKDDPSAGDQRRPEWRMPSPGRLRLECVTLERLMYYAYAGLGSGKSPLRNTHPLTANLVRGGPRWIRSERFNIEAKADGAADRAAMMGPMLRALLEDRFQLKTHRETEEGALYALTVAKGGPKIKPIGDDGCTPPDATRDIPPGERFATDSGPKPTCGSFVSKGDGVNRTIYAGGQTMAGLANVLSLSVDRFVIDGTGLGGRFNIRLTYGFEPGPNPSPSDIERGPSIFTALQEQLGLKLESTRGRHEFLVVDRVQRPDPN